MDSSSSSSSSSKPSSDTRTTRIYTDEDTTSRQVFRQEDWDPPAPGNSIQKMDISTLRNLINRMGEEVHREPSNFGKAMHLHMLEMFCYQHEYEMRVANFPKSAERIPIHQFLERRRVSRRRSPRPPPES